MFDKMHSANQLRTSLLFLAVVHIWSRREICQEITVDDVRKMKAEQAEKVKFNFIYIQIEKKGQNYPMMNLHSYRIKT